MMQKYEAIEIIKEKSDKMVLFNDLKIISEHKKLSEKILSPVNLSASTLSFLGFLAINHFFIHNQFLEMFTQLLYGPLLITLFLSPIFGIASFAVYCEEAAKKTEKFYGDKKIVKKLSKHYSLNNKINSYLESPLSLNTYKYLATVIDEEELKEIAALNLTYQDLGLENYYRENDAIVKELENELKIIEDKNKAKEAELLQIEENTKKENKKQASDVFVSSLYKNK